MTLVSVGLVIEEVMGDFSCELLNSLELLLTRLAVDKVGEVCSTIMRSTLTLVGVDADSCLKGCVAISFSSHHRFSCVDFSSGNCAK